MSSLNMSIKKFLTFISIILCYTTLTQAKYLDLPFYTKYPTQNQSDYFLYNFNNYLYSKIQIGSNNQTLEMRMQLDRYATYVVDEKLVDKSNTPYHKNKSETYFDYKEILFYSKDFNRGIISREVLNVQKYYIKYFKFIYSLDTTFSKDVPSGSIGLDIHCPSSFPDHDVNLIDQLKENKLISGHQLSILFDNQGDGRFIIGSELTEADESYKTKVKIMIKAGTSSSQLDWGFKFKYVYLGESRLVLSFTAKFSLLEEFILSTNEYSEIIYETFFSKLVEQKKCFIQNINTFGAIKCLKDTDISNFTDINFFINDVDNEEFRFSFTKEDLFEIKDDFMYFKVLLANNDDPHKRTTEWTFGKMFFKKFLVTLDKEQKIITFYLDQREIIYNNNNDNNNKNKSYVINNENNSNKKLSFLEDPKTYKIFTWILLLLLIIFVIVFIIFMRKYLKRRKKRRNTNSSVESELSEYISQSQDDKLKA